MNLETEITTATGRAAPEVRPIRAAPSAAAYLLDADAEDVVRRSFADLGLTDAHLARGDIATAIEDLPLRGSPRLLLVDVGGGDDPLPQIRRLAEICTPDTEIIAVGTHNDIVLYRDLRAAGVAEYFFKPLIANLLSRTLIEVSTGERRRPPWRDGKLIFVLGVRGGAGATTIASTLAWHLAEGRQRRVALLDLDLYAGNAAVHLDVQPNEALREALSSPERVDELFLARGVVPVSTRLGLLATLLPLSDQLAPSNDAIHRLLDKLLPHFRYVLVDLPSDLARAHPGLLQRPSTVLLVSDGEAAGIREVARWRDFIGPDTAERTLLHLLNKQGADGRLADNPLSPTTPPPDIAIAWDREVMRAATRGTRALQACGAIRHAMTALSRQIAGVAAEEDRSLWQRIFG